MMLERHRSPLKVNMTPLIDMVFLLLIFFMLTTQFNVPMGLNIESVQAEETEGDILPENQPVTVLVDDKGQLEIEGRVYGKEDIKIWFEAMHGKQDTEIFIKGQPGSRVRHVVAALGVLKAHNFTNVTMWRE